jgi:hypothetical protein
MSIFEKLEAFEDQSIQTIAFNMCKWFDFDSVNINTEIRHNVESGVWINIKIQRKEKAYYIDGQRNDIVKRRLIEWLRSNILLHHQK